MIGNLGRRAIEVVVLLFAALGFAFVPLGRHTALEHMRAILGTGAAASAGHELAESAKRLERALFGAPHDAGASAEPPANAKATPAAEAPDAGADASQGWPAS